MAMQEWEVSMYRAAAMAVCQRMNEHPEDLVQHESGATVPRWVSYAIRMHQMRLMQAAMMDFGPFGPL